MAKSSAGFAAVWCVAQFAPLVQAAPQTALQTALQTTPQAAPQETSAGNAYVKSDAVRLTGDASQPFIPRADYDRIMRIQGNSLGSEPIAPDDVKFLLRYFAAHESNRQVDLMPGSLSIECLSQIVIHAKTTKPSAKINGALKEEIYNTVAPYVRRCGEGGFDLTEGMMILGGLGNKKAIPLLLPYAHSADKNIKIVACYALKDLGHPISIPEDRPGATTAPAHQP